MLFAAPHFAWGSLLKTRFRPREGEGPSIPKLLNYNNITSFMYPFIFSTSCPEERTDRLHRGAKIARIDPSIIAT